MGLACKNCQTPIDEDFGVVTCKTCGTTYMIDFDGQLVASSEFLESSQQNEFETQQLKVSTESDVMEYDSIDSESIESESIGSNQEAVQYSIDETAADSIEKMESPITETLEASEFSQLEISSDEDNSNEEEIVEEIKVTWSDSAEDELISKPIPTHPPVVQPVPNLVKISSPPTIKTNKKIFELQKSTTESIMNEVANFGNSQKSNAISGWYLYNLTISGLDSKDVRGRVLQAFADPRLKLEMNGLLAAVQKGTITIKELSPVKVFVLANALKSLPLELYWEQHELTD